MPLNTSFLSLFIPYTAGYLCRKYGHLLLLLFIVSVHGAFAEDQIPYDLGDYQVECPDSNWLNVDANCFQLVDANVYSWKEANNHICVRFNFYF